MTCTLDTSLAVAASLMEKDGCASVSVIDRHGRVVGHITDRDICLAVAHSSRNALHIAVHEVMTPNVLTSRQAAAGAQQVSSTDDDIKARVESRLFENW